MIYCVWFDDVAAHLSRLGFTTVYRTTLTAVFLRGDEPFTIRLPNENGDLPENLVLDAFDKAALPVGEWPTHWCD